MFEHKHWILRFVVFTFLFLAVFNVVGGMWGIFAGVVALAVVKAAERPFVRGVREQWAKEHDRPTDR